MEDDPVDKLPASLRALGDEFERVAAFEAEAARRGYRRPRRRGPRRTAAAILAAVLLPAGALAMADRLLDKEAAPVRPGDGADELTEPAAPGVVLSSAAPDPEGGNPWALRVFSNNQGQECYVVGRLREGQLGIQTPNGVFRRLPAQNPGNCGNLDGDRLLLTVDYRPREDRVLVYGLSGVPGPATLRTDDGRMRRRLGALGTFVFVLEGPRSRVSGGTLSVGRGAEQLQRRLP